MVTRSRAWLLLAWLAVAFACNPILGITSASVDPLLDDAGGAGNDGGLVYTCDAYCATIAQNCTGVRLEYIDTPTCLAMCAKFDKGGPGDTTSNSLACRVFHATAAATDPDFHCPHAGPSGGAQCGDPCLSFCGLDFVFCGDRHPYASETECQHVCPAYPYVNTADAGDLSIQTGPSLNCRIWHLESAVADPATHCQHTSLSNPMCTAPPDASFDAATP